MIVREFSGSPRQRGEQHGESLGSLARDSGIMDFYQGYCEREALGRSVPVASELLNGLHSLFASRLSGAARELITGFSRASGMPQTVLSRATVMPDVINYLIGASGRLTSIPTLGCTSVAAWGDQTLGGRLVYGRNLDFVGNGLWDKNQLVARHRPDRGIPYVSLSSAGCAVDGITGLNEEGLSVDLHQHISTDVGYWPGGRPILDLGLEVLQFARTIEEAAAIVERSATTSGWSLVLTHWRQKRAAVLERTPRHFGVQHYRDGALAYTNTYREPVLRGKEIDAPAFRESSRLREARAWDMLQAAKGRVEPQTLVDLLGDHVDPERRRVRAFVQCIAQPNNLTSVVMDPEAGVMWVAQGPAPMCDTAYRRVGLWSDAAPGGDLSPRAALSPSQGEGYARYLEALRLWQNRRDQAAAAAALGRAVDADPGDPAYRLMRGLFLLMLGEWRGAADSFEAGAALPDAPHRSASQRYWRARALDALVRRGEAQALYREAARAASFGPLKRAAERGALRAQEPVRRVIPDMFHADAHRY